MKCKWLIPVLAAALLGGCGAGASERAQTDAASAEQSEAASAAAETDTAELPAALVPVDGAPVLEYDRIQLCVSTYDVPSIAAGGYYTVCSDDLWGLIRSDGTELLPCQADNPVLQCPTGNGWHWEGNLTTWTSSAENPARFVGPNNIPLCDGHCIIRSYFLVDDSNNSLFEASFDVTAYTSPITNETALFWGDILPCRLATFEVLDELGETYDVHDGESSSLFVRTDGTFLNNELYDSVGWFFNAALAPAERNGKWAYIDRQGQAVTDFVYDASWSTYWGDDEANYLLNGYAAVCRDGRWGLLDETGAEFLPCQYDGVAWNGYTLWLDAGDGWHAYRIDGLAPMEFWPGQQADLTRLTLPESVAAPDSPMPLGSSAHRVTDADHGLVLRAGPGTDYDKLDVIPKGTSIRALACSSAASNWMLTEYNGQYGWVCTDYLR